MNWRMITPAAGIIRGHRMTIADRFRLWKRRRHTDDLAKVRREWT